jgi:hypothetical protein
MNETKIVKVRGHDLQVTAEAIDRSVRKSSCVSPGKAFDRFCEERLRRARPLAFASPELAVTSLNEGLVNASRQDCPPKRSDG